MKDEIKEILDKLKDDDWYDELDLTGDKWIELKQTETKQLLDYITNLQQENERLKNGYCKLKVKCNNGECDCTNEEYEGMVQANMRVSLLLDDYKSRCEKAIEFIKNKLKYKDKTIYENEINWLLNILRGDNK